MVLQVMFQTPAGDPTRRARQRQSLIRADQVQAGEQDVVADDRQQRGEGQEHQRQPLAELLAEVADWNRQPTPFSGSARPSPGAMPTLFRAWRSNLISQ